EPAPSSLVRRRRLLATAQADGAGEKMARAGLRRALLAGWARELGLRPAARELERARAQLAGNAAPDDLERLAEEIALEELVLAHAPRMLNDGPSPEEALAAELRTRVGGGRDDALVPVPRASRFPPGGRRQGRAHASAGACSERGVGPHRPGIPAQHPRRRAEHPSRS